MAARDYDKARAEFETAKDAANIAYASFELDPDNIEYAVGWSVACMREAAAAAKKRHAEEALREAGGYTATDTSQ